MQAVMQYVIHCYSHGSINKNLHCHINQMAIYHLKSATQLQSDIFFYIGFKVASSLNDLQDHLR